MSYPNAPTILLNINKFKAVYAEQLAIARVKYPDLYNWSESELPDVLERMNAAIDKGTFNKDTKAFEATCKILGIKHTYQAIAHYVKGSEVVL